MKATRWIAVRRVCVMWPTPMILCAWLQATVFLLSMVGTLVAAFVAHNGYRLETPQLNAVADCCVLCAFSFNFVRWLGKSVANTAFVVTVCCLGTVWVTFLLRVAWQRNWQPKHVAKCVYKRKSDPICEKTVHFRSKCVVQRFSTHLSFDHKPLDGRFVFVEKVPQGLSLDEVLKLCVGISTKKSIFFFGRKTINSAQLRKEKHQKIFRVLKYYLRKISWQPDFHSFPNQQENKIYAVFSENSIWVAVELLFVFRIVCDKRIFQNRQQFIDERKVSTILLDKKSVKIDRKRRIEKPWAARIAFSATQLRKTYLFMILIVSFFFSTHFGFWLFINCTLFSMISIDISGNFWFTIAM